MLIDTSAWVEYFKGSERGQKLKTLLEEKKQAFYICPLTIAEIAIWCCKNSKEPSDYLKLIKSFSLVLEISEEALVLSGKFYCHIRKINEKIGLIDCIIYTTAQIHGMALLTKDRDFEGLAGVDFL